MKSRFQFKTPSVIKNFKSICLPKSVLTFLFALLFCACSSEGEYKIQLYKGISTVNQVPKSTVSNLASSRNRSIHKRHKEIKRQEDSIRMADTLIRTEYVMTFVSYGG